MSAQIRPVADTAVRHGMRFEITSEATPASWFLSVFADMNHIDSNSVHWSDAASTMRDTLLARLNGVTIGRVNVGPLVYGAYVGYRS